MTKAWWVSGIAIVVASVAVGAAQAPRPSDGEIVRARQKISMVEGTFERAVQNGADNFARQIRMVAPNAEGMAMLMGAPQVRGFRIEHFGVFFDVQMPSLQLSMVWPLRYTQGSDAATNAQLVELRSALERNVVDPAVRVELIDKIREVERELQLSSRRRGGPATVANVQSATATAPPASPVDPGILDDPADAWRREVRITLTDAMIENTGGVTIAPEEFIVVAARGVISPDRLVSDPGDARTIELRLKGTDLAAFRAGTLTLEETRKRVEVREY